MSVEERQKAFNNAVFLVYRAFPKQSDATSKNQLYRQWTQCNRAFNMPLVCRIISKRTSNLQGLQTAEFCDLLKDCSRISRRSEVTIEAVEFLPNKAEADDLTAWTLPLQASMEESIGKVHEAIELNLRGYEIRMREVPLKGRLLGGFQQNLGYNYNTANAYEKALEWFEKSRDTWTAWNIKEGREADWPTELLDISTNEFKKESELNWAMRGDQTRLHPFHAGCVYNTGVVCLDQGKFHAKVIPAEYARSLFKLFEALSRNLYENSGDLCEVADLRDEAEVYLLRRNPDATDFTIEDEYDRWVPIFWRATLEPLWAKRTARVAPAVPAPTTTYSFSLYVPRTGVSPPKESGTRFLGIFAHCSSRLFGLLLLPRRNSGCFRRDKKQTVDEGDMETHH
ncbi:hypothetical protein V8F33_006425 [Rhypophila sp. PSN 637]